MYKCITWLIISALVFFLQCSVVCFMALKYNLQTIFHYILNELNSQLNWKTEKEILMVKVWLYLTNFDYEPLRSGEGMKVSDS